MHYITKVDADEAKLLIDDIFDNGQYHQESDPGYDKKLYATRHKQAGLGVIYLLFGKGVELVGSDELLALRKRRNELEVENAILKAENQEYADQIMDLTLGKFGSSSD